MPRNGVFCVEGQWHRKLDEGGSVLPTLELLERLGKLRYIHKDVATREELRFFLKKWALSQYAGYRVGFFAMHGQPGSLCLSDSCSVDLAEVSEPLAGRCEGRRLYFGSCSVMRSPDAQLVDFLKTTGAAMVCGYTKSIDWVESAAFETVLLDVLVNSPKHDGAQKRFGAGRWAPLAAYLGFKVVYADGRTWRPAHSSSLVPSQRVGTV